MEPTSDDEAVVPPQTRTLVTRISARRWSRIEDVLAVVGWACFALVVPAAILGQQGGSSTSPVVIGMMVLATLGMVAVHVSNSCTLSAFAATRETKAGYTTALLPHQPELDLVDDVTGTVIRPVGAKALTEDEYRAAISQAHSATPPPSPDKVTSP